MALELEGKQLAAFCDALLNAFPGWSDLEKMVEIQLGEQLEHIVAKSKMETVTFELVKWARSQSRLDDLLAGALRANPTNTDLQRLASELAPTNDAVRDPVPAPTITPSPGPPVEIGGVVSWIARNWRVVAFALFILGLAMLMGAIGLKVAKLADPTTGKQVGYISSLNWSIVYLLLCPAAFVFAGWVIQEIDRLVAHLASRPDTKHLATTWRRELRRWLPIGWVAMSAVAAVLYTVFEGWLDLLGGKCGSPEFVGWTQELCLRAKVGSVSSQVFLLVATAAQISIITIGCLLFVTAGTLCARAIAGDWPKDAESRKRIETVLALATVGWAVLLTALCLARFWSFHLQTGSEGLVGSLLAGAVFDWRVAYQTDAGSIAAIGLISVMGISLFELAHWQGQPRNKNELAFVAACFSAALAILFPRLVISIALVTALILIFVPIVGPRPWQRRVAGMIVVVIAGVLVAIGEASTPH